jgi:hypothetical protein
MRNIVCAVCGSEFLGNPLRKYCDGCRVEETRRVSARSSRAWQIKHPKENREVNNKARRDLYANSQKFRITQNLRTNFNNWMDSFYTGSIKAKTAIKFFELTGLTPSDFIDEMRRKWQEKYNTRFHYNRAYIQINHKIDLSTQETEEGIRSLWHHSNLSYTKRRDNPQSGRPRES